MAWQFPAGFLTPTELAEVLKVSTRTLARMRGAGVGPTWTKLGHRTIRYSIESVQEYLATLPSFYERPRKGLSSSSP